MVLFSEKYSQVFFDGQNLDPSRSSGHGAYGSDPPPPRSIVVVCQS